MRTMLKYLPLNLKVDAVVIGEVDPETGVLTIRDIVLDKPSLVYSTSDDLSPKDRKTLEEEFNGKFSSEYEE